MSLASIRDHPIALLPKTLTFPRLHNTPGVGRSPSLKICTTPHVSFINPLISESTTGKNVEECVDVVVPVGGMVNVNLKVEVGDLLGPRKSLDQDTAAEDEVRQRVRQLLVIVSGL